MSTTRTYEELVAEAIEAHFSGWDFSWLLDRATGGGTSWSYPERARQLIAGAESLLDIDTGGGELLAGLGRLPAHTAAAEAWEPNLESARGRLGPLGVEVRRQDGDRLPAGDAEFDLVLNRHGSLEAGAIRRALRGGGVLLTQQVGGRNDRELNEALGAGIAGGTEAWSLDVAVAGLERAGFAILDAREEWPEYAFLDIGAVVYQLRAVPWQVPDFDPGRYETELRELDARIRAEGRFVVRNHRFLIEARADLGGVW